MLQVLHRAEPGPLATYFGNMGDNIASAGRQMGQGNATQAVSALWQSNPELLTTLISMILGALFGGKKNWGRGATLGGLFGAGVGAVVKNRGAIGQWAGRGLGEVAGTAASTALDTAGEYVMKNKEAVGRGVVELANPLLTDMQRRAKESSRTSGEEWVKGAVSEGKNQLRRGMEWMGDNALKSITWGAYTPPPRNKPVTR